MNKELIASVQYNDMKGTAALDGQMGGGMHGLAEQASMPKEYFPVAMSVYFGETDSFYLSIYACSKSKYGNDMDTIMKHNSLELKKFDIEITKEEFFKSLKRFDIKLIDKTLIDKEFIIPEE